MEKKLFYNYVIIFIIVVLAIVMFKLLDIVKSQGVECLANPFTFEAKYLEEHNPGTELMCSCNFVYQSTNESFYPRTYPTLKFDSENVWTELPQGSSFGGYNDTHFNFNVSQVITKP